MLTTKVKPKLFSIVENNFRSIKDLEFPRDCEKFDPASGGGDEGDVVFETEMTKAKLKALQRIFK